MKQHFHPILFCQCVLCHRLNDFQTNPGFVITIENCVTMNVDIESKNTTACVQFMSVDCLGGGCAIFSYVLFIIPAIDDLNDTISRDIFPIYLFLHTFIHTLEIQLHD